MPAGPNGLTQMMNGPGLSVSSHAAAVSSGYDHEKALCTDNWRHTLARGVSLDIPEPIVH